MSVYRLGAFQIISAFRAMSDKDVFILERIVPMAKENVAKLIHVRTIGVEFVVAEIRTR